MLRGLKHVTKYRGNAIANDIMHFNELLLREAKRLGVKAPAS